MEAKPTEKELEILQVLWQEGSATVRDVNDRLSAKREIGYTTTLKIMQIMYEKGLVTREKDGKTHIYKPAITEAETQSSLINELMDTAFRGSAMKLVMGALGARKSTRQELDKIRAYLDKLEGGEK